MSPKLSDLPHLLKLLDDENLNIQQAILKEFRAFGPALEQHLIGPDICLAPEQKKILGPILDEHRRTWLREEWPKLINHVNEEDKLETAFQLLSEFQHGRWYPYKLPHLLDDLANEYSSAFGNYNEFMLARFLFDDLQFQETDSDYHNPENCNLVSVIVRRLGIPVSLTCLYILVGKRLGLSIEGCNLPGHFLARVYSQGKTYLVDTCNRGKVISEKEIQTITRSTSINLTDHVHKNISSSEIIERLLRRLIRCYQVNDDRINSYFILDLLNVLKSSGKSGKNREPSNGITNEKPDYPKFKSGQLIKHRKYGYRGVIVDFDTSCCASEIWYESNESQPNRNQPWYHVLVDGGTHNTYVAQSNILPDDKGSRITHPLINYYFTNFKNGHYTRNNIPWDDIN